MIIKYFILFENWWRKYLSFFLFLVIVTSPITGTSQPIQGVYESEASVWAGPEKGYEPLLLLFLRAEGTFESVLSRYHMDARFFGGACGNWMMSGDTLRLYWKPQLFELKAKRVRGEDNSSDSLKVLVKNLLGEEVEKLEMIYYINHDEVKHSTYLQSSSGFVPRNIKAFFFRSKMGPEIRTTTIYMKDLDLQGGELVCEIDCYAKRFNLLQTLPTTFIIEKDGGDLELEGVDSEYNHKYHRRGDLPTIKE